MKIFEKRIQMIQQFPQSIGVEVGVCKGYFSLEILEHADVKKLYSIDAWAGEVPGEPEFTAEAHERNLREALSVLHGHMQGPRLEVIRGRSLDVARSWSRSQLTWAYIDGSHAYADALADLIAWSAHVVPGGALLGHDYVENDVAKKLGFGVKRAVDDFCQNFGWRMTGITSEEFPSFQLERVT